MENICFSLMFSKNSIILELWPEGFDVKTFQYTETIGKTNGVHGCCYQFHGKHLFY